MRLFVVELNRFRSRRAVVMLVLAAVAVAAVMVGTALWDSRPVSADDQAGAERQAQRYADDPVLQRDIETCEKNPEDFLGPRGRPESCADLMMPRTEDFLDRQPLVLAQVLQERGNGLVLTLAALLIIAGATFAGADWSTRSISNQVLFEPRRTRVWLAKGSAVLTSGLVAATVVVAGFWVTLGLAADARGISTPDRVLQDIGWTSARGVLLAATAGLGGYALTMLLRSTVATVGVLFAYAVGGELLVLALPLHQASQWSLANNVFAWLQDGVRVYDEDAPCRGGFDACDRSYVLGLGHAAAYLGVLLLVALLASLLSFRRRDIP